MHLSLSSEKKKKLKQQTAALAQSLNYLALHECLSTLAQYSHCIALTHNHRSQWAMDWREKVKIEERDRRGKWDRRENRKKSGMCTNRVDKRTHT